MVCRPQVTTVPFPASQYVLHTHDTLFMVHWVFLGGYTYQYPLHINSWVCQIPCIPPASDARVGLLCRKQSSKFKETTFPEMHITLRYKSS